MSMILEIGAYLASVSGFGGSLGTVSTDIFEGLVPDEPDNCIVLFERPGRPPVRASANTIVCERPGLAAVVRHSDYELGYTKAKAVKNKLQNFQGILSGTRYLEITANQGIHSVGTDELRRYLFSINFNVMKDPS